MANLFITPDTVIGSGIAGTELASTIVSVGTGHNTFNNRDYITWMWLQSQTGTINLTIYNQQTIDGIPGPNRVNTLTVGQERFIGPWPASVFNDSNGLLHFNIDTLANVLHCMLFRVPRHTDF